jgi:dolichyl-diphosphooligosaccharide--protein glycosyltransferase
MRSSGSRAGAAFLGFAGLAAALLVAIAARSLGLEQVFLGDGTVVFNFADAFYHARLALFSFENFPRILAFDSCLNFPHGAPTGYPPLWDWTVAGVARLFGSRVDTFERVAAWMPVVAGSLTTVPVYFLGRTVADRWVGVGAAFLYALLPVVINYSQVGNMDHHAVAGLFGAVLLAGYVVTLAEPREASPWAHVAVLGIARAAMLLTWNGGLLYIVPGDLALMVAAAYQGDRRLLGALAASAVLTACVLAPVAWLLPTPVGGPYSATELSRFQPLAFSAEAVLCAGLRLLERLRPAASPARRLVRLSALAAGVMLLLLAVPGVFVALRSVFEFLTRSGGYTAQVLEQLPLFYGQGGTSWAAGERRLAYFAYLVPFTPLAFVMRSGDDARRPAFLLLFGWTLVLGFLTLQQARFANDYAPAASVGWALLLRQAGRFLAGRRGPRLALAIAVSLGALMLAPTVPAHFYPSAWLTLVYLRGDLAGMDRGLFSVGGTQTRFAQTVAAVTPPTPGCDTTRDAPTYGILAHPAIGHSLHYTAHRATPADPWGPFSGPENWDAVNRFLRTESEEEALGIAKRLGTPFVLTAEEGEAPSAAVAQRLQREDGSARPDAAHLGHFRLVAEGPDGGIPIAWLFAPTQKKVIPYKLFEIVEGAQVEVPAEPGQAVVAELPISTSTGRNFVFRARAVADEAGIARLRLPYATDASGPTQATGGYRISGVGVVQVPEQAVRDGAVIALARPGSPREPAKEPATGLPGRPGQ